MKSFITVLISILLLNNLAYGQDQSLDSLQRIESRIQSEITLKSDTLKKVQEEINHLKNQAYLSSLTTGNPNGLTIETICRIDGKLRDGNNPNSKLLTKISKGDTIRLTDYKKGYWIVNKGQHFGYMSELYIKETEDVKVFKEELIRENKRLKEAEEAEKLKKYKEEAEAEKKEREEAYAKLKKELYTKYGSATGDDLLAGKYWIGMSDEMTITSLGNPHRVNRTVGEWGVKEQWVYNGMYLYFTNGILKSYQD